jgi:hypothetical protein
MDSDLHVHGEPHAGTYPIARPESMLALNSSGHKNNKYLYFVSLLTLAWILLILYVQ